MIIGVDIDNWDGDEMNVIDQLVEMRTRGIKVVSIEFMLRELVPFYPNTLPDEQEVASQELLKENSISISPNLKTSRRCVQVAKK